MYDNTERAVMSLTLLDQLQQSLTQAKYLGEPIEQLRLDVAAKEMHSSLGSRSTPELKSLGDGRVSSSLPHKSTTCSL